MQTRSTRILNISVPPNMLKEIEEVAEAEHRTKSELMREAFRHYKFMRRWRVLRELGKHTAERFKLRNGEELEKFLG